MIWEWAFFWYVSPKGACVRDEMDILVQDALLAQLRRQRTIAPDLWSATRPLHGKKYRDFYENVFVVGDVQQRPMGFMGPGRQHYTIVAYATHKQRVYDPAGVFGVLKPRRDNVLRYGGCRRAIKLD
jgi:hypothetical protein